MLQKRNDGGRHRHELFRAHIHVIHLSRRHVDKVALTTAGHAVSLEHALVIDRRVGLGHDVFLFGVCGQIINLLGHLTLHHLAVGGFDKPKIIYAGEGRQRRDQADVRSFRRFNRANTAVVRGVHVAHLKAGAITGQAARPQRGQAALVRGFSQRIDLIHELAELAAAEEIANHRAQGLRVHQLGRRHGVRFLIEQSHALFHETLGTGQAHAALVGDQLTHRSHTTRTEVINVIQDTLAHLELEQITRGFRQIILGQRARFIRIVIVQLLANLVTTHPTQVITFRIEEQALEQGTTVGHGGRIARAQSAVDFLERFLLIVRGILLHALDDEALVAGDVHHTHLGGAGSGNLLKHSARQRLEGAGHNHVFLLVLNILCQHKIGEVVVFLHLLEAHLLDVVKHLEDLAVGALGAVVF